MRPIWIIAKKEISSFFDSLIAYILLAVFLGISGLFTWLTGNGDVFFRGQADLGVFFQVAIIILMIFIPAITMRSLAEEKKSGTIELLLTKSVSDRQLVLGKFMAALALVAIALLFTLVYYISVSRLGNFDHGANICGYFGLLLVSAAFVSIGLFASSLTNNQIIAFIVALVLGATFLFLFGIVGAGMSGWLGDLFATLNMNEHYQSISRGVIDSKDIIYFLSITVMGLVLSEFMIAKRN